MHEFHLIITYRCKQLIHSLQPYWMTYNIVKNTSETVKSELLGIMLFTNEIVVFYFHKLLLEAEFDHLQGEPRKAILVHVVDDFFEYLVFLLQFVVTFEFRACLFHF